MAVDVKASGSMFEAGVPKELFELRTAAPLQGIDGKAERARLHPEQHAVLVGVFPQDAEGAGARPPHRSASRGKTAPVAGWRAHLGIELGALRQDLFLVWWGERGQPGCRRDRELAWIHVRDELIAAVPSRRALQIGARR